MINNIAQTKLFKNATKIYREPLNVKISKIDFSNYTVPPNMYMVSYTELIKNYSSFKLHRLIYDEVRAGLIKPVMLADPIVEKAKSLALELPQNIFTFGGIADDKSLLCYVDTSMKARYTRNKMDNSPESYKIDMFHFYAFMQSGFIWRHLRAEPNKFVYATELGDTLATIFAILLSKVIDKNLSISAHREGYTILLFLCMCYFYEFMMGLEKSTAIMRAKKNKIIYIDVIEGQCEYVRKERNFSYNETEVASDIFPINKFIEELKEQYKGIKLDFSTLLGWWNMYGQNSIFAIEDYTSFLLMISLVELKANFFNDLLILGAVKDQIKKIPDLISKIVS